MARGDVHLADLHLPDRQGAQGGLRQKYVVVLQSGPMFANCQDVAVVVCSTYNRTNGPRPYEVLVGTAHGFARDTIIDCRWPFTVNKQIRGMNLRPQFTLSADVMEQVSEALAVGLQL